MEFGVQESVRRGTPLLLLTGLGLLVYLVPRREGAASRALLELDRVAVRLVWTWLVRFQLSRCLRFCG
jgi:hypothetical protein